MGEGFGRSGAFGARGTSAPHAILSSCPVQVTRVCSLAAVSRNSRKKLKWTSLQEHW
jgi:hypothetical protein